MALRCIERGRTASEVGEELGVSAETIARWQHEYGSLRLESLLAEPLAGDCQLNTAVIEQIMSWREERWDVVLIHPPYVVDRGDRHLLAIPWAHEHIGSSVITKNQTIVSPLWQVFPMGFPVLSQYLTESCGLRCARCDLAGLATWPSRTWSADGCPPVLNLEAGNRSVVSFAIQCLRADVFAVGLHWLVHTPGAVDVLRLIKQIHPDSQTVIGGLTSSVFAEQALEHYPFVDFVILGDGCEPLGRLVEQIKGAQNFAAVPNLLYREANQVRRGPREALSDWDRVRTAATGLHAIQLGRGCPMNCVTCGGSCEAGRRIWQQQPHQAYDIESIMRQILSSQKRPDQRRELFFVHDPIVMLGRQRWRDLLAEIRRQNVDASFLIEVYRPMSGEDIRQIADALPGSAMHFSPESIDEQVRTRQRSVQFSTAELIANMDAVNEIDDLSLQVWFMAGVAGDQRQYVDATVDFIADYHPRLRHAESCFRYNTMTFVDPGSNAWMQPEAYGYKLLSRSMPWYVEAFAMPHFKYHINYEMHGMSRGDVFHLFLHMHDRMNEVYRDNGLLTDSQFQLLTQYHRLLRDYESRYDAAVAMPEGGERDQRLGALGDQLVEQLSQWRDASCADAVATVNCGRATN